MKKISLLVIFVLSLLLVSCDMGLGGTGSKKEQSPFEMELGASKIIMFVGEEESIEYSVEEPFDIEKALFSYNEKIIELSLSRCCIEIKALKAGNTVISITYPGYDEEYGISVEVKDKEVDPVDPPLNPNDKVAPVISLNGNEPIITLVWGKTFNPLEGITATDDVDGDITSKIKVTNPVNNKEYGKYTVTYEVTDNGGNTATLEREVEVVWDYDVLFIGHAGSFYGAQNSEAACIYALEKLQYQSLECDLKRTKDGQFVCSHNDTFTKTNGDKVTIAQNTLEQLQAMTFKETRSGLAGVASCTYQFRVMTLKRYLEICKDHNAIAIIELKGCAGVSQDDQSGMQALMDEIESVGMRNQVIFLASAYNTLIWTRTHGYSDIPCQYLMNMCDSEAAYNRCMNYNLDISINVTYSDYVDYNKAEQAEYENWIRRYQAAGKKVSVWTFTQYCTVSQVQYWIDFGVDFVTCDWQPMDQMTLPEANPKKYEITYLDDNGLIITKVMVKEGKLPYVPVLEKEDHEFLGWDKEVTKATGNATYAASWKVLAHKYNINYVLEDGAYWDLNPRVTGNSVGVIESNANSNYWTDYASKIFLFDKAHKDPAKFSHRVLLKLVKDNYYEIVAIAENGAENPSDDFDLWLQVGSANSSISSIQSINKQAGVGDIVYVNGDTSTGCATLTFYKKASIAGLVVDNYQEWYSADTLPQILPTPTCDGQFFVGWSMTGSAKDAITLITESFEQDITLYAIFTEY